MDNAQASIAILKWVVNPELPVPEIKALDEDALFDLVNYHRVLGQVLARLEAARPKWCPTRFLTRLRMAQHHVRREAQERIAAAREITRAMQARGLHPPIFVKGFAAYALTGDPANLHYSGDLDPFAEDLPAFWDVLQEIGYRGKRKDTHEWAKLARGGVTVDIHRHFPMLAYSDDVRAMSREQLDARRHPGSWHLPDSPPGLTRHADVLAWDDLASSAEHGKAKGTTELLFPSPTVLCFIHCVHCFRDSITRLHYMNPVGGFRLCELLSIRDLSKSPEFDMPRFQRLTHRFRAHDAVEVVRTLSAAFFQAPLLADESANVAGPARVFPEQLIYGGWVSLQKADDWLLRCRIEQLLEQLGAMVVPVSCFLSSATASRVLTYGAAPVLSFQVEIAWNREKRIVTAHWSFVQSYPVNADHDVMIHFGHGSYVEARFDPSGEVSAVVQKSDYLRADQQPVIELVENKGRKTIRMVCNVPLVPFLPDAADVGALPVFLAARRLRPDGDQTEAACYLPLILQ